MRTSGTAYCHKAVRKSVAKEGALSWRSWPLATDVSLGGVTGDLGRESLEQLDRIVLGCRLQAMKEESDERGGPTRFRQMRQNGRPHAMAKASQAEKGR